jgi:vitamin K-dependent gamma-carboxylase
MATDRAAGLLGSLRARAAAPVSAASLGALRVIYGATLLAAVVRFAARGWIDALYVRPAHLFAYWGFGWVPRPGATGLHALFAVMGAAAVAVALGWRARVALGVFALCFTWVELLDRTSYLNHYYFVSVFTALLALLPVSARYSLDARRDPSLARATVPAWTLWIPRAQLAIVYLFAGVAKLKGDWLLRAEPLRTWLLARADAPVVGPLLATPAAAYAMSWAGTIFDLTIPWLLLSRRTRVPAYLAVIGFHAATGMLFNIGMFPWVMVGATTVFFDPAWPERFFPSRGEPTPARASALPSRALTAGLALYFAAQLLLPLRMHLYPGDACWTEQGFRFAWHVMVMEKAGDVRFRVTDPHSGRAWVVEPGEFLSPTQARVMAGTPDMILTAAHFVRDDFARRGVPGARVYADAWASLHGRPARRLVDPRVDLAREEDSLRPYRWVYPDPATAPDH